MRIILLLLALLFAACGEGVSPVVTLEPAAAPQEAPAPADALVFRLGGVGEDSGQALVADAAGNLFVAGHFTHQSEFGTSRGGQDVFLARYDGQGNLVWALGLGSGGHEQLASMVMDELGNLYLAGTFEGRVAFDGATEQAAAGLRDAFLASYDSDGRLRWARTLGAAGESTGANDLALGERGELYLTGGFTGTVEGLTSAGEADGFLARFDLAGQSEWLRRFGGPGPDSGRALAAVGDAALVCEGPRVTRWSSAGDPGASVALPGLAHSLAGDRQGGFVAAGEGFLARFGPALEALWSVSVTGEGWLAVGEGAIFLAGDRLERFDLAGNRLWERALGGEAEGLALVRGPNPTVTGSFAGLTDFSLQGKSLTSTGGSDGYVAQYNEQGQLTSVGARPVAYQPPAVTYNGLHKINNPTAAQVTGELSEVKKHFASLRSYYPQYGGGTVDLGKLTKQLGLNVYLGLFLFPGHNDWTAENYANYVKPAVARGNVAALIIGNEDPQDLALILSYLDKARTDFPKLPASSAQTTTFWLTDASAAKLAAKVDFIAVNIYPGWDGVPWSQQNLQPLIGGKPATPADSFNSFKIIYGKLAARYPGLPIVVTETGWPTTYGAPDAPQPKTGITNAKAYLTLVQSWAVNNKKNVFIYGMYDDTNAVNTSSLFNYHFGLLDTNGKSKGVLF